ncbi:MULTISPECIES: hypothetical protein [Stutzerimonas stutzeri subgroup]|uniref:hypothetical protein n=1 Tax=Stutzerimonas stutzeri subgroup TaxID=578833 RepID=UPI0021ADD4B7|nr:MULTISPECIES: hypothetical protein [Stutzerimonas stutzeri subgroup]MDH0214034.1 hypothetical protein [Stutzerimonas stutzeri]MDH0258653.1 hypothetical protein [Stutzerimonas stutzeri]MDH0503695.1 hypothetical protein [Stutzerimonas stutzeri]
MDTLTLASIILTLGFISLGLLLYFQRRTKQRRAAIDQEQPSSDETVDAEDRAYAENFYCFMLTDGTCRSGFTMDPPKRAPDVRIPGETLPSESRLNDGLPQLEERVHPGEHPRS